MFKRLTLDNVYYRLKYGKSVKQISTEEISTQLHLLEKPVFFLSTGRCGTKWMDKLISSDKNILSLHAPVPNLALQNKFAYNTQRTNANTPFAEEALGQIFLTAREQHFRYAYKTQKRIVETNNHITFFAYAINKLLPQARFVHLYRNPVEFVRSGARRGWYTNNKQANAKVITPLNNSLWNSASQIQKIAWLWNETNQFIENFKDTLSSDKVYTFNFNLLTTENIKSLIDFMNVSVDNTVIDTLLNKKVNVQSRGRFPTYDKWKQADKSAMADICGSLAGKYGFSI